jgi:hypothetical protein
MAAGGSTMADRQFTCPVAGPAEVPPAMLDAAVNWQRVAGRWRDIAERRSAHYVEMFYSGRWKHYYTDAEFLAALRSAILMARRWSAIAPRAADHRPVAAAQPEPRRAKAA